MSLIQHIRNKHMAVPPVVSCRPNGSGDGEESVASGDGEESVASGDGEESGVLSDIPVGLFSASSVLAGAEVTSDAPATLNSVLLVQSQ